MQTQRDGNLVPYDGSGTAVWASDTAGYDSAYLLMQDDGSAVICKNTLSVWATITAREISPEVCEPAA
ncbi:MAG TPA: hypothetical protein VKE51_13905 [Vicinamibacterales bacterium]|nr:hypothetical protein [Vicinamibacterales bacterium]